MCWQLQEIQPLSYKAEGMRAIATSQYVHLSPLGCLFLLWSSQYTSSSHNNSSLINFNCFVNQGLFTVSDNHNTRQEMNNRDSTDRYQHAALRSMCQGNPVSLSPTAKRIQCCTPHPHVKCGIPLHYRSEQTVSLGHFHGLVTALLVSQTFCTKTQVVW